jgi:hypothetical protein
MNLCLCPADLGNAGRLMSWSRLKPGEERNEMRGTLSKTARWIAMAILVDMVMPGNLVHVGQVQAGGAPSMKV